MSYGLRDGYAERGVAVQNGDADLEFSDLTVEVPCHEALAQQFHAVHPGLDAAPAVGSFGAALEPVARRPLTIVARGPGQGISMPAGPRFGPWLRQ